MLRWATVRLVPILRRMPRFRASPWDILSERYCGYSGSLGAYGALKTELPYPSIVLRPSSRAPSSSSSSSSSPTSLALASPMTP
jgi:hypothetical protein